MLSDFEARISCPVVVIANCFFEMQQRLLMKLEACVEQALGKCDVAKGVQNSAGAGEANVSYISNR